MRIRIPRLHRANWRTAAALAAATAIVGAAVTLAAPDQSQSASGPASPVAYAAAHPSQGGCNEYAVGSTGFEIGVCINDRGTGTTAYPDIYLNHIGPHTGPCSISIELWDNSNRRYGTAATAPCTPGLHTGNPYGPISTPLTLHTFARLNTNGTSYYLGAGRGDSPALALGPDSYSQTLYNWDIPLTFRLGSVGVNVKSSVPNVFKELHRCFNCNFPIPGAPAAYPAYGQLLNLTDLVGIVQAPVRAYPYDASGYLLYVAQPGHFDGAGSTVQFTFQNDSNGYTHLHVTAHAVGTAWTWFSKIGAAARWNQFARQLGSNLLAHGEGTILH